MASRPSTAEDHLSDGVPTSMEDIDEITDRIDILGMQKSERMGSTDLGRVLASFESQLMELNKALTGAASAGVRRLNKECEQTAEEVQGLNSELKIVVGETG